MSVPGDIFIGVTGLMVKVPAYGRTYAVSTEELSRQERMASGKLCREVIAVKKKFTFSWSLIDSGDLTILRTYYDTAITLPSLILQTYQTAIPEVYNVILLPIDYARVTLAHDGLWTGVTMVLNEV